MKINTILFRKIIQYLFLGISISLFLLLLTSTLQTAHEFCPYASVCFGAAGIGARLSHFLFPAAIIVGLIVIVSSMFFGRWFCGYVCPIGTIQELIYSVRGCNSRFRQLIPYEKHRYLNALKYVVFLFTAITAYFGMQYLYMKFCPVLMIAHFQRITIAGIFVLTVIVIGSFFVERLWCRYLCPYAALMNIFQKLAQFLKIPRYNIRRNIETSIDCPHCPNYCPMGIDIKNTNVVPDVNCIKCLRCIRLCQKGAKDCKCIYKD